VPVDLLVFGKLGGLPSFFQNFPEMNVGSNQTFRADGKAGEWLMGGSAFS
jgi:hypothetical protein